MSMERHGQELSLDQLRAISAGIILDDNVGVDVDPIVDRCNLEDPRGIRSLAHWSIPVTTFKAKYMCNNKSRRLLIHIAH